jgi:uncharacterized lipoprotein YddW (UPF0748 family)
MRYKRCVIGVFLCLPLSLAFRAPSSLAAPTLKGRAVWAGPRDAGTTAASVAAFAEQLAKAHINTVIMELKGGRGICWPSTRFAGAVVPEYRQFDLPAVLIRECHKRDIQVHAWFIDFAEGADSYVVRQHPEWLALNPEGKPTTSEILRGRPYGLAWMCPARRPGYTDQWLIPLIREFVERYDIDAVHHDYVRYPGDLAPESYCFCDYCLEHLPLYAGYYSPSFPELPFYSPMDRPHLEAHWERSPRVLPANWSDYSREMKSRFLLQGSYFPGGNHDLDYFFYEYRVHWIREFVRQVFEEVGQVKPDMEVSAAVFKNPVQSGRFIGQDWRCYYPWVQYLMPMDYRSHFPGDFDTHLQLLAESIASQKEWARDFRHLWVGIATGFLYDEERGPLLRIRNLAAGKSDPAEIEKALDGIAEALKRHAPGLYDAIQSYVADPKDPRPLEKRIDSFLANVPPGYYPAEKLTRTLEMVRSQGVEGIVIFSAGGITSLHLWDAVEEFFSR